LPNSQGLKLDPKIRVLRMYILNTTSAVDALVYILETKDKTVRLYRLSQLPLLLVGDLKWIQPLIACGLPRRYEVLGLLRQFFGLYSCLSLTTPTIREEDGHNHFENILDLASVSDEAWRLLHPWIRGPVHRHVTFAPAAGRLRCWLSGFNRAGDSFQSSLPQ
jgi:hypothetical protein